MLYNGAGVKQALVVTIPGDGVTGVVFSNVAGSFRATRSCSPTKDGTVSGWRGAL